MSLYQACIKLVSSCIILLRQYVIYYSKRSAVLTHRQGRLHPRVPDFRGAKHVKNSKVSLKAFIGKKGNQNIFFCYRNIYIYILR